MNPRILSSASTSAAIDDISVMGAARVVDEATPSADVAHGATDLRDFLAEEREHVVQNMATHRPETARRNDSHPISDIRALEAELRYLDRLIKELK